MNWKYGEKATEEQLKKYLDVFLIVPEELKKIVQAENGGRPVLRFINLNEKTEIEFKRLLSIDEKDSENVYLFNDGPKDSVPFGISPSGDVFFIMGSSVYIHNHETQENTIIAESFSAFLNMLHD